MNIDVRPAVESDLEAINANDASVELHKHLGFHSVGVLNEVGYKNGEYWSTEILERPFD